MGFSALEPAFRWTIVGIFALLVMATTTIQVLQRLRPESDWTEMRQRVNSWWIMAAIFTMAMIVNRTVSLVFFAFVSFIALKEYLSIIPTRRSDRRVLFWAYLAVPLQYFWIYQEWYGMFIIFIPVFMFLLLPLRMLIMGATDGFLRAMGTLHWGLMITVFSLSHAAFLLILRLQDAPDAFPGPGMVLYLVVLTQFNDVAQFLWGKSLGMRKIVPAISPGKTWTGFLGGVATTTVVAWLAGPFLTPLDHTQSLFAGLIIGVGGFLGDINISALKRDLHIKDSGNLLPGHGGILDRIDSLTYTAPLFFHYVYFLVYFHTFGVAGPARML